MVEKLSDYRNYHRMYNAKEFLSEVEDIISDDKFDDFVLMAQGESHRVIKMGSRDREIKISDLFFLLELSKRDIMDYLIEFMEAEE